MATRFAEHMNIAPEDAMAYVETFMEVVWDALGQGDRIEIRGFGVFQIQERKARKARNPRSGTPVEVACHRTVRFKPGKRLRERVRDTGLKTSPGRKPSRQKTKA